MSKKITSTFIADQKKKIVLEQEEIKTRIEQLKNDDPFIDPDHASDNAAVDTDVREQVGHDTVEAEIKDLQKKADDLHKALKRIEKKKYGYCEKCGSVILQDRLELIPEASYCIDCEKKLRS